ncbi:urea transporter [Vibrio lamellibrachiae]|uniref:urea transporter n=1 Tax=Vibrio lamellibrachiae TaxID=2910253 RepID=UPI003D0C0216
MKTFYYQIVRPTLKGIGQIALVNSALTGALFLIALLFHDLNRFDFDEHALVLLQSSVFIATLFGALTSLATAYLIGANYDHIKQGLYGYNGALLGLASTTFFIPCWSLALLVFIGSAFTSLVMHTWRWKVSPFTFPFLITIAFIFHIAPLFELSLREYSIPTIEEPISTVLQYSTSLLNGIGQVLFQSGLLFSVIILIGIAASSLKTGLWTLIGASIGLAFGVVVTILEGGIFEAAFINSIITGTDSFDTVSQGLYGFNSALITLALCQSDSYSKMTIILGAITASILTWVGYLFDMTLFTFPFVLSTWLVTTWAKKRNTNLNIGEETLN